MDRTRVVITGLGVISPLGLDKDAFWEAISKGRSGIKPITGFDTTEFKSHNAGEIVDFNPRDYIKRKSIRLIDRISRFATASAYLALKDADLEINSENSERIGIVLGSMYSGWTSIAEFHQQMFTDKLKRVNPMLFPNTVPNSPASQISIEFGIRCLNTTISTGFASGSDAIGWAFDYLRNGRADVIVAGGAEELNKWLYGSFDILRYLAISDQGLSEDCRSFDAKRRGLVLSEGAAMLVLETLEHATKRGAHIYGEIAGYGSGNGGFSLGEFESSGEGASRAMCLALEDAGVGIDEVDYISAEGNATILGDKMETQAVRRVFRDRATKVPLSSIKSMLGHSLGAAGAFGVIASILAIKKSLIPPTINYVSPDPDCDLDCVPNEPRREKVQIVMANSFGPEGNNSSLILRTI